MNRRSNAPRTLTRYDSPMKRALLGLRIMVAWIVCVMALRVEAAQAANVPYGIDLRGKPLQTLSSPGALAIVLVFLATDCPISNRYQPELAELGREFSAQHIQLWIVYPNPAETAAGVEAH